MLRKSDELTGACRNYLESIKTYLESRNKINNSQPDTGFSNAEIRKALKINHSNQKRYMLELQQSSYIKKGRGDKKKGFVYEIVSMQEYEQLQSGIASVLDQVLAEIKAPQEVQSSKEVQVHNELLNTNTSKVDSKKFKKSKKRLTEVKKA